MKMMMMMLMMMINMMMIARRRVNHVVSDKVVGVRIPWGDHYP